MELMNGNNGSAKPDDTFAICCVTRVYWSIFDKKEKNLVKWAWIHQFKNKNQASANCRNGVEAEPLQRAPN
ncbi:hypothetical protein CCR75_002546 [Bremia lactucae]|uniref:Uncharacterized protein n=1 Tax=Bremia lactucae TaxID=4779 RepID=A0A976IF13_BRELC|nr:hypothetical protein CCR75_002546 [Bremia lactucae]